MKLQDFNKTRSNTEFVKVDSYDGNCWTKNQVLAEVEGRIEKFLASGSSEKEIKETVESMVADFEPYDKNLRLKTKTLMKKWGLKK